VNGRSADPGLSCRAALKRAGAEGAKPRSAVDPGDRLPGCIEAIEGVAADFQGVVSIPAFVPGRIERSDKMATVDQRRDGLRGHAVAFAGCALNWR